MVYYTFRLSISILIDWNWLWWELKMWLKEHLGIYVSIYVWNCLLAIWRNSPMIQWLCACTQWTPRTLMWSCRFQPHQSQENEPATLIMTSTPSGTKLLSSYWIPINPMFWRWKMLAQITFGVFFIYSLLHILALKNKILIYCLILSILEYCIQYHT